MKRVAIWLDNLVRCPTFPWVCLAVAIGFLAVAHSQEPTVSPPPVAEPLATVGDVEIVKVHPVGYNPFYLARDKKTGFISLTR